MVSISERKHPPREVDGPFRCGRPPQNRSSGGRPVPLLPPSRSTNRATWRRAADKFTFQHRQSPQPAADRRGRPCAAVRGGAAGTVRRALLFDPPAHRRRGYAKGGRQRAQRNALPIPGQAAFLIGDAGAGVGGLGDVAASAVAAAIDLAAFGNAVLGRPVGVVRPVFWRRGSGYGGYEREAGRGRGLRRG